MKIVEHAARLFTVYHVSGLLTNGLAAAFYKIIFLVGIERRKCGGVI